MEDLDLLMNTYREAKPSELCYLDARYFNVVLGGYAGLVLEPIRIQITEDEVYENKEGEWRQKFFVQEMSSALIINLADNNPDLVRVIVEIVKVKNGTSIVTSRHSNLLIVSSRFDASDKKRVYLFVPIKNFKYHRQVVDMLADIVNTLNPPNKEVFVLRVIQENPQITEEKRCQNKSMSAAYVLKMAVMYITGRQLEFSEDINDISCFAGRVQELFRPALVQKYSEKSEPDIEYTGEGTMVSAIPGAVLGGRAFGLPGSLVLREPGTGATSKQPKIVYVNYTPRFTGEY